MLLACEKLARFLLALAVCIKCMGVMQTKHDLFFSRVLTYSAATLIILVHSLIEDRS